MLELSSRRCRRGMTPARTLPAAHIAAPAGVLAISLATACDRSSDPVGMEGEAPPPIEEGASGDSPDPAAAGGDPYAQNEAEPGAADPAGGAAPPPQGAPPETAQGGQPPMGGAPEGEAVSDEELEAFAEAYLEVEDVQQELEAELHAAQSNEEAQEIQQRAIAEIRDAVEETGMDFETYGLIAQRLQQDPALIQRVESTIEQMRN